MPVRVADPGSLVAGSYDWRAPADLTAGDLHMAVALLGAHVQTGALSGPRSQVNAANRVGVTRSPRSVDMPVIHHSFRAVVEAVTEDEKENHLGTLEAFPH